MLRLRHLLRSTQSTFRVSPPLSQPVKPLTVRRVKYKKPWVRLVNQVRRVCPYTLTGLRRKFVTSCLIYGTAFHLWSSLVFLQLDDADASEEPRLERTTRENNDNDEEHKQLPERLEDLETTFVPLSLPLIRPGEFYATSDKEWQEFAKFSRDDEKLKKLKSIVS